MRFRRRIVGLLCGGRGLRWIIIRISRGLFSFSFSFSILLHDRLFWLDVDSRLTLLVQCRIRYQVMSAAPLNFSSESAKLSEMINAYG